MTVTLINNGHLLDLERPDSEHIDIESIAGALSKLCRFNGHTSTFYSVAQHSIAVCDLVRARGGSIQEQLQALLHDAHEAYLGDVCTPLKTLLGSQYADLCQRMDDAISAALGVKISPLPEIVLRADHDVLSAERQMIMPANPGWVTYAPEDALEVVYPGESTHHHEQALFLDVFHTLADSR